MVLYIVFIKILWNEIKKEFFNTWSYKWQWLGEFISLSLFFFFLSMVTAQLQSGISYCIWLYSILIIGDISGKVAAEMRSGTFEQIYLSSIFIPLLFISKIITSIFKASVIMLSLLLLFGILGYVQLNFFNLRIFYGLGFITPGLFGISFLIGGLTILVKETGWLINVINNSFLFLSGVFLPLDFLPDQVRKIALLIPTAQAVNYLKDLSDSGIFMISINMVYLCVGVACFFLCERKAKIRGTLGYY